MSYSARVSRSRFGCFLLLLPCIDEVTIIMLPGMNIFPEKPEPGDEDPSQNAQGKNHSRR